MINIERVESLDSDQLERLARFLLFRMDQRTRGLLMAEMPVIYSRLTGVDPDVVLERVARAIGATMPTASIRCANDQPRCALDRS